MKVLLVTKVLLALLKLLPTSASLKMRAQTKAKALLPNTRVNLALLSKVSDHFFSAERNILKRTS